MYGTTYGSINNGTLAERAAVALDRKLERIATLQAIMDSYADTSRYCPDTVTFDYEEAVSEAIEFAEFWNMETDLDC